MEKENKDKMSFIEIVQKQIEEKKKDSVIKVIKEKEAMVKDTVEKKECVIMLALKRKGIQ